MPNTIGLVMILSERAATASLSAFGNPNKRGAAGMSQNVLSSVLLPKHAEADNSQHFI